VRYLLDTHVLLWWIRDDPKLRADTRTTVMDPNHDILVSAASIWEAAGKRALVFCPVDTRAKSLELGED
jgi:PIN domain nuclease of toxin-antitoxin system